jgi:hypothetical protein
MANIPLTSKQMVMKNLEILQEAFTGLPRWLVDLNEPPRVVRASLNTAPLLEYSAGGRAYFVRAQDELEAFMKARKMEAENNERY